VKKLSKNSSKKSVGINWENELKNMSKSLKKEIIDYNERYRVLSNQGKKLLKEKIIQRYNKLKEYFEPKISREKFKELTADINPPSP